MLGWWFSKSPHLLRRSIRGPSTFRRPHHRSRPRTASDSTCSTENSFRQWWMLQFIKFQLFFLVVAQNSSHFYLVLIFCYPRHLIHFPIIENFSLQILKYCSENTKFLLPPPSGRRDARWRDRAAMPSSSRPSPAPIAPEKFFRLFSIFKFCSQVIEFYSKFMKFAPQFSNCHVLFPKLYVFSHPVGPLACLRRRVRLFLVVEIQLVALLVGPNVPGICEFSKIVYFSILLKLQDFRA